MKEKIYKSLLTVLAVILFIAFGAILMLYSKPMEDVSLDLSLALEDGAGPEDFDDKGWTVYTQEGELVTELEPDGLGNYYGIELGQTLYYSRTLEEEMDSPTMQIGAVNRQFSVWLDDVLIYTDCPELDNRIGYVTLPMSEWDRMEPIIISLPINYQGKTLTIAQSTPEYNEGGALRAYPASVMLYCGYSYESGLISESFTTAVFAAAAFVIGVILLILMILNTDLNLLFLALIPFLWMISSLIDTSFFYKYFGTNYNNIGSILTLMSAGALLIFLTLRAGKYRKVSFGITAMYLISLVIYHVLMLRYDSFAATDTFSMMFITRLPQWLAFLGLASTLVFGLLFWRKENTFYQIFCFTVPAAILIFWLALIITDAQETFAQVIVTLNNFDITYIYYRILWPMTTATLLTAIIDTVRTEINRRAEKHFLEERREMTLESYENLRRQHEEIMMIRHDMMKHFHTLNDLSSEHQVKSYLEEIIGQNQKVRSIVQSGNQMLDIILNSKLSTAMDAGIEIDIIRVSAPRKLPVSDADLCSLMMNIMDNAFKSAISADKDSGFIRLDIHEKNDYLTITCENTAQKNTHKKEAKKETAPGHGLGLKIIRGIVARYHGLFENHFGKDTYKIQIAIPLS